MSNIRGLYDDVKEDTEKEKEEKRRRDANNRYVGGCGCTRWWKVRTCFNPFFYVFNVFVTFLVTFLLYCVLEVLLVCLRLQCVVVVHAFNLSNLYKTKK